MEKLIIYAVGGVLYFLYNTWKKSREEKPLPKPEPQTETPADTQPKPVKPTFSSTLEEIRQEIKQKQAEAEKQSRPLTVPRAQPMVQKTTPNKDLFIHEKKKATFGQGADDAPVYERDIPASEKIVRGDIKLKNEGIYRIETMEEARALADNPEETTYEFDAKQAFIGSIIFERKF